MQDSKNPSFVEPDPQKDNSETISELAERHLKDQNHTTTDEEIRNAKVEVDGPIDVPEELEELYKVDETTIIPSLPGETNEVEKNDASKDKGDSIPNPYDVLG